MPGFSPPIGADVPGGVQPRVVGQKQQDIHPVGGQPLPAAQGLHGGGVPPQQLPGPGIDLIGVGHEKFLRF